jgi:hypothetical protein
MQEFLPGTARYLELPDTWVLPIGPDGHRKIVPIDASGAACVPITMSVGRPISRVGPARHARKDRRLMMGGIGRAVADLLPAEYRGVYGRHH